MEKKSWNLDDKTRVSIYFNHSGDWKSARRKTLKTILAGLVVIATAEAALAFLSLITIGFIVLLFDLALMLLLYVFSVAHYAKLKFRFSTSWDRSRDFLLYYALIFVPSFLVLYLLDVEGLHMVFAYPYVLIYLSVVGITPGLLVRFKHGWRHFSVRVNNPIKLSKDAEGSVQVGRGPAMPENTEKVMMDYLAGKIDSDEFINLLGDSKLTRTLLQSADKISDELKSRRRFS